MTLTESSCGIGPQKKVIEQRSSEELLRGQRKRGLGLSAAGWEKASKRPGEREAYYGVLEGVLKVKMGRGQRPRQMRADD